ncbi:MAG TPA: NAD-dependent succinate-semialdehyde dehydrogenase [Rhodocyclaceae bacterium]|nr:NAD-dependent succinate-semialdehyde dehydrogenase [Rhodocyclaceae bacterium]
MTLLPEFLRTPAFFIDGVWRIGTGDEEGAIVNPATGEALARYRSPSADDVDAALEAAGRGFRLWRRVPAIERGAVLRRAATLMRERMDEYARVLTLEEGKPLAEARGEWQVTADMFEWFAEEARRAYGRLVPARSENLQQQVVREPIGPVAAFAAWNFPARNPGYKIAAALAAGCSCIAKPAEETPLTCLLLAQALADAGLPAGVLNVLYGDPVELSSRLIASPVIRKISFTGSTRVGQLLAVQAAQLAKPATLELGGQAPVLVFDDADIDHAVGQLVPSKYRNAGQTCISPTRFFVQEGIYVRFVEAFAQASQALQVGDGMGDAVQMGPIFHERRLPEVQRFVEDAITRGARIVCGGQQRAVAGYFWEPTVVSDLEDDALLMRDEPFGPIAAIAPFATLEEGLERANALPYGLGAYAFTTSLRRAQKVADGLEVGMIGINTAKLSHAETPFGGVKQSGHGSEGGTEGLDAYLVTKSISLAS